MIDGRILIGLAFAYLGVLFLVAWMGDHRKGQRAPGKGRPTLYALSLAVYCTSWTFFGSVGLATSTGYDFFPVYTGAIVCFLFCSPLIRRIVRLSKHQNITSVADFLAARYGKSQPVAAVVTLIAVLSALPYIALQLKAVALSVDTIMTVSPAARGPMPVDTALVAAAALALFAVLFGTRHADATEHQHGLILAIATESIIKLVAFLAVGVFILLTAFGGLWSDPGAILDIVNGDPRIAAMFDHPFNGSFWLTVTGLSFIAVLLLPRQFHVIVVENNSDAEIRRAAWMFPLYLLAINLFVIPIAIAGMVVLPHSFPPDTFVLGLPIALGNQVLTLVAFVGGLSAATAMVVVDSVALALMVCNGLIAPMLLRRWYGRPGDQSDLVPLLLRIRRVAIVIIIFLGYAFYRVLEGTNGLALIGLVSFAGIAQLAPAFFIGLVWRKATALGAIWGMSTGIAVWAYTLVLPWFAKAGLLDSALVTHGPFGLTFLAPQALFYLHVDPLSHGVWWSLAANVAAYVAFSLYREPAPVQRLQTLAFVSDQAPRAPATPAFRRWRTTMTAGDLQAAVARYVGTERAARSFQNYAHRRGYDFDPAAEADAPLARFSEYLLSSAIGAASARLVLSLLVRRGDIDPANALRLLDDASEALQHNRDLLQSALDQVRHGLSVFDHNMRLVSWNRQYRELLDLPPQFGRVGVTLDSVLRHCAERGDFGPGRTDDLVAFRLMQMAVRRETFIEPGMRGGRRVLEIRSASMPQGGIVTTYADITERVTAADAMAQVNESLEGRVADRTAELNRANTALAIAKAQADAANLDKTRFLASASHDILQPLNAARLYVSSLVERQNLPEDRAIAGRIDQSLKAVEEILGSVIEIARLDTSRLDAESIAMPVRDVLERLRVEFEPLARERGLELRFVPSSLWIKSDRRLLPRLMQNLVSNALKYTVRGGVVVGARRGPYGVTLQVVDTGVGIAAPQQSVIFKEFTRLPGTEAAVHGLGLGLSIVDRISRVLDHRVTVRSVEGRGSVFSVTLPRAATGIPEQPVATLAQITNDRLAGLRILCIDNDDAILDGMHTLLEGWRCQVMSANSTADALAGLAQSQWRPDVVLADYHLDADTGLDAIAAIHAFVGHATPALVISADASGLVQRHVREAGYGILRKPLKVAALRSALNHVEMQIAAAAE